MRNTLLVAGAIAASASLAFAIDKPKSPPQPPKVSFSEFNRVELKAIGIAPKAKKEAEHAREIFDELIQQMKAVAPSLTVEAVAAPPLPAVGGDRTLVVEPFVEDIKFVGGGSRFMIGALAGKSAVLMKVTFREKATGEVLAEPEFYQDANAFAGAYSMGSSDNAMLRVVAGDAANYYKLNGGARATAAPPQAQEAPQASVPMAADATPAAEAAPPQAQEAPQATEPAAADATQAAEAAPPQFQEVPQANAPCAAKDPGRVIVPFRGDSTTLGTYLRPVDFTTVKFDRGELDRGKRELTLSIRIGNASSDNWVAIARATLLRANGEEIATAMGEETIEDDEGDDWLEVRFNLADHVLATVDKVRFALSARPE